MRKNYFVVGTNDMDAAVAFYDQLFGGSGASSATPSEMMTYSQDPEFAFAAAKPFDESLPPTALERWSASALRRLKRSKGSVRGRSKSAVRPRVNPIDMDFGFAPSQKSLSEPNVRIESRNRYRIRPAHWTRLRHRDSKCRVQIVAHVTL